jgi:outer membrane protein TolC
MVRMKLAELDASRNRIAMKSTLMDPMLMLGVQDVPTNSFRFDQEMMTGKVIGLTQDVPFPGKLSSERAIAAQDTLSAGDDVAETRNELDRAIKLAFYDIYHLERSNDAYRHHVRILDDLIQASESRVAAGKASAQSVLALKLEQSSTKAQIIDGESMVAMRVADLSEASGVPLPEHVAVERVGMPEFRYTLEELDSIASRERPLVQRLHSQADQAGLQGTRNALDRYPDFSFSLMYMQRDVLAANAPMNPMNTDATRMLGMESTPMKQSDLLSASVSITLPLNSERRREGVAEAEAMRTMKQSEAAATLLTIHTMLASNLSRLHSLVERHRLITSEVLPLITESQAIANTNLASGSASIEDVLRNDITTLHRQHDLYEIEAEYNKTIAQIEYLVGRSLVQR